MDPDNLFSSQLAKNLTKLAYNLTKNEELAQKRFDEVIFEIFVLLQINYVILFFVLGYCHFEFLLRYTNHYRNYARIEDQYF